MSSKPHTFIEGEYYKNDDIANLGGPLRIFLPNKDGHVVAGRFNEKKNPGLPNTLLVGTRPRVQEAARLFRSGTDFIPVFIKPLKLVNRQKPWRYQGQYRVRNRIPDPVQDAKDLRWAAQKWPQMRGIASVLHLEREPNVLAEAPADVAAKNPGLQFTPEFEGSREYIVEGARASISHHGTVVNALYGELSGRGRVAFNTQNIDLYLVDDDGEMTHLFEIKTDLTTTGLYGAIGQLMIHGAVEPPPPRRIVVVPGTLKAETAERMRRLGIRLLAYDWKGDGPVFEDLESAIRD